MKAVQYTTTTGAVMRKTTLVPTNIKVTGAFEIKTAKEALKDSFLGFGVALTGASCYELNTMPKEQRDNFLKDIYTSEGLDLEVGRVSIGSCDYSAELYSYDDVDNDTELEHFSVDRDKNYIIPMIKEALKLKPDMKLLASPWSPPGWMKVGGSMCGGYMREKYIECYARYIVKFLEEYEKQGINIFAVTPQNELETDQDGRYPACKWHPEIEAKYILELRKKLNEVGKNTEIWMHDHNFNAISKIIWCFDEYPELMEACGSVAFHYYDYCIEMTDKIKTNY